MVKFIAKFLAVVGGGYLRTSHHNHCGRKFYGKCRTDLTDRSDF